jgi:hypothetical protein
MTEMRVFAGGLTKISPARDSPDAYAKTLSDPFPFIERYFHALVERGIGTQKSEFVFTNFSNVFSI